MPYDLRFDLKPDYLRVEIAGVRLRGKETADALDAWSRIGMESLVSGMERILCIARLQGRLPVLRAFEIGEGLANMGRTWCCKVAYVDTSPQSLDANRFGERVAANRGICVKVFSNEDDARNWLMGAEVEG